MSTGTPAETKFENGITLLKCNKCNIFKPLNFDNFYAHTSSAMGVQLYCKSCMSVYSKNRNTKEKNRKDHLKVKYNITIEEYNKLYEKL